VTENVQITPTYQSTLILNIQIVSRRLADGMVQSTWEGLKALYVILPPECEEDVKEAFEAVKQKREKLNQIQGVDSIDATNRRKLALKIYQSQANFELFSKFKKSLYEKDWLKFDRGAKPKYEKKGHLKLPTSKNP